ncbi:hypothetical protein GCM10010140_47450 [Streptosporangium pseudovulgare]|uniref:Uncharacterized protein n=1 Tax=Streptosporangium pseudovulgare TaxID=35765 RepID=A0ABQ2R749_9ACTN|nr:hypothetical protein GCM10010140_47450 [Streptosporangium pseudovulgare]
MDAADAPGEEDQHDENGGPGIHAAPSVVAVPRLNGTGGAAGVAAGSAGLRSATRIPGGVGPHPARRAAAGRVAGRPATRRRR